MIFGIYCMFKFEVFLLVGSIVEDLYIYNKYVNCNNG